MDRLTLRVANRVAFVINGVWSPWELHSRVGNAASLSGVLNGHIASLCALQFRDCQTKRGLRGLTILVTLDNDSGLSADILHAYNCQSHRGFSLAE